ncbi:preprotein translocase subunit SecE [Candidatus Roizmanbacteria bacterium RIFCSPHIGHO2_01_FULL_35_10]|nr:MAG: preprotein translocase subunit SecE [Candidatus Roizmanbacteria bacterium RIFCSPHIGHO2_01_FULL_35_10]
MDKKTLPAPAFTRDIIEELKKVTWPSRENTIRLTLVVVGMSLIIGLYIGIIDILLTKGLEFLTQFR